MDPDQEFQPEVIVDDGVETVEAPAVERSVVTDELERHEGQSRPSDDDATPPADAQGKDGDDDQDGDKDGGDDKQARGRFLEDGRYEVTRADGTKVVLDRDELPPAGASRRAWYRDLTQKVEESERQRMEMERRHKEEIAAIQKQIRETSEAEQVKEKPWLAKDAAPPTIDDFDSVDEWANARDEWKAAQSEHDSNDDRDTKDDKPDGSDENQQAQRELQKKATEMLAEGAERFPDFEETVKNNPEAPFDPFMTSFLLHEAEDAAAAFHYFGTHVDEAVQLRATLEQAAQSNDYRGAIRALAMAEARATLSPGADAGTADNSGVDTEADKPKPPARASSAPDPIRPTRGTAAAPRRDPDKEPVSSYIERRRKEELGL